MAQDTLGRIEKAIAALAAEVTALREQVDALRGGDGALTSREIQEFLDQYRAGESLGETSIGAWIATCKVECLRGGLRNVQLREGSHARLLEARLKELGGTPHCELPESVTDGFFGVLASAEKTDLEKLECFFSQVDSEQVLRQLGEKADRMGRDPETQALLRSIIEDERASLAFLCGARELLARA
jgi:hypothetical protein